MFNRKLQVSVVKDPKRINESLTDIPVVDITESAKQVVTLVTEKVIYGVAVYIAFDTLRQVIVKSTKQR